MRLRVCTASIDDSLILESGSDFPDLSFPDRFPAFTVHSVYRGALNLVYERPDSLCTLVTDISFMHPRSALVHISAGLCADFVALGLFRGMKVRTEGMNLIFDNLWKLSASGAKRIDARSDSASAIHCADRTLVLERGRLLAAEQKRKNTRLRWSFFADNPYSAESAFPPESFEGRFVSSARETAFFLETGDARSATLSALRLTGLGSGLTPSGDDFLCGLALAFWIRSVCGTETQRGLSPETVQAWLDGLLEKADGEVKLTTDVSLMFLRLARRRLFSRSLLALAGSFVPLSPVGLFTDALAFLGLQGHSSGLDSATGFLFGLQ